MSNNVRSFFMLFLLLVACNQTATDSRVENSLFCKFTTINFHNYSSIYSQAKDSVANWISDSLASATSLSFSTWQIDSVFCFNSDSSRFFSTINKQAKNHRDAVFDYIQQLGGAKINGRWYFLLSGVNSVIPREQYQDSTYSPLTFEELSYLAHRYDFKDCVLQDSLGNFYPNDKFFNDTFYDSQKWGCACQTKADFDSLFLERSREMHQYKMDPEEINDIKRKMTRSVKPPEPKRSWWEKTFGEKKIFETEGWKCK